MTNLPRHIRTLKDQSRSLDLEGPEFDIRGYKKVVIESPLRGDGTLLALQENVAFAALVCKWAFDSGYNPYASHVFFTQFLSDHDPRERSAGMALGLQWGEDAAEVWVCTREDEDWRSSRGLLAANAYWIAKGKKIRHIKFKVEEGRIVDQYERLT